MPSIAAYVAEYRRQYRADPETADRSLLEKGRVLLDAHRQEATLAPETMHAGFDLLDRMGDVAAGSSLLRQYLGQSLTLDERAWAWWHLIDSLAGLHRCEEVVQEHTAFWHWAIRELDGYRLNLSECFPYHPFGLDTIPGDAPGETLAPEILRLWVMHDGTQAKGWVDAGAGEAWLQLAQEALAATPHTLKNRHQRFNFLRTLAVVAAWSGHFEAGLRAADQITELAEEETEWELQQRWRIDGLYVAMRVHIENQDQPTVRNLGEQAIARIEAIERHCAPLTRDQSHRLGNHTHNIACVLRGIGQYEMAIPLFERTIQYRAQSAWTYLYLASAIWATTADRDRTLALLHQASVRHPAHNLWQEAQRENLLPEFEEAEDAPAFERAANGLA